MSFNPCVSRNSSGAFAELERFKLAVLVSIHVLVGIAQELKRVRTLRGNVGSFNPCVSRNSSGALLIFAPALANAFVSIRVLVGIAQEPGYIQANIWTADVSIRVLVGIAQEPRYGCVDGLVYPGFNPCVSRNSSGAGSDLVKDGLGMLFQSVC